MTPNDRKPPPHDTWQSRGPSLARTTPPGPVTIRPHHCPDAGTFWRVLLGGVVEVGHSRVPALAEAQAAAVRAALAPLTAPGERATALLATDGAIEHLTRHCASRRSAAIRVARFIATGEASALAEVLGPVLDRLEAEGEQGEALTLDRAMVGEDVGGAE